ncbi:myocardin-related transcription factor B isoform X2 [Phyllopteryx taeniolatus]|uniref:myocardin-related transcription factor B isoform X2 n=1 Tax=Phyllopteryx taeniolatus TaxID=161469 RepID=UPI002AD478C2|nr:myocardin-related transcription factor B isoform X2 [Phyllopteryx taeniolatus]
MGLQSWPPSTAPSMMACLHVETPSICTGKFKSALQLRLQHRRSREQLVEQGIMPPLKAPAAFHERICSLERATTGNLLKHKLSRRPARSELVRMHILKEGEADASVQAAQMKLKRARLADDLSQKISSRPGPMKLVEKNILPVDAGVNKDHDGDSPDPREPADVYTFTEDNSDALSPDPCRRTSPSTGSASPIPTDVSLPCSSSSVQISPKPPGEKSRSSKKSREAKPRIRKLKYHQYIPPDHHKHEFKPLPAAVAAAAHVDAAYVRILQQQQHFLQLQILSQQHFGHQQAALNSTGEFQTSCSAKVSNENCKPNQLPANVDEMKVAELKVELKLRSLPVSGTKMDLIERLKLYHESFAGVETKAPENTPPVSPKVSVSEDNGGADGPAAASPDESGSREKDRRLYEKERQIEELKRRLEREQRLVEQLKLQLEVEKRSQQPGESSPPGLGPLPPLEEERVEVGTEEDTERSLVTPPDSALAMQPHHGGVKLQPAKKDDSAPLSKTCTGERTAQSALEPFPSSVTKSPVCEVEHVHVCFVKRADHLLRLLCQTIHRGHPPPAFVPPPLRKCKNLREPPRYEDAVKHTRMLPAIQGLCAASQQMDDLFDILIESGEMSPFLKPDPPDPNKRVPVTPSVTLLPVNTVLSRPPPRVQVAHMPAEELPLPPVAMEMDLDDDVDADSDLHAMDWLDLSVSAGEGVFSTDFLDTYQLL